MKYFVENGYKVNNRDIKASIKNNCLEILKYFVENGVDVNADEALLSAADGGHLEIIK